MQNPAMKKQLPLSIITLLFLVPSYSQDLGFRTTDLGAEIQLYPQGKIYNLHIALNAKLNHSFQLRLGYNEVDPPFSSNMEEFGNGWGGGAGYRYYFKPFPYHFFIGFRSDVWKLKVLKNKPPNDIYSRLWIIHPAIETGYTFIINDQLYITPFTAAGVQITLKNEGTVLEKVGKGFVPIIGLGAGMRL
jgi:hypothetical protein